MPATVRILYPVEPGKNLSSGTGFFIDDNGHVATVAHTVVGSPDFMVEDQKGRRFPVRIEAIDELTDVAILRLDGYKRGEDPYLQVDAQQNLSKGSNLFNFGFPGEDRTLKLSQGALDGATNRESVMIDVVEHRYLPIRTRNLLQRPREIPASIDAGRARC